jgi:hypothetical protein
MILQLSKRNVNSEARMEKVTSLRVKLSWLWGKHEQAEIDSTSMAMPNV